MSKMTKIKVFCQFLFALSSLSGGTRMSKVFLTPSANQKKIMLGETVRSAVFRILPVLLLAILLANAGCFAAETVSPEELFFEANRAYKEGRYQQAADDYQQLADKGFANGDLYYNLGNACLRTGRLGPAILNYKRAQVLIPRDADLNYNLRFALDQTKDAVSLPQNYLNQAFFWLDSMTLRELLWAFGLLNVVFWGVLVLRLFSRQEWTYYVFIVLLIFWLMAGASLGVKWYQLKTDQRAVILAPAVDVLAGPESNDTVLFKLHEGTTVQRERTEGGWSLIQISPGKRGWIESSAVEKILSRTSRDGL
jgi:tetratricopeptide (TPR) repeat protein